MKKILQILIMLVVVFWGNKVAAPVSISNIPDLPEPPQITTLLAVGDIMLSRNVASTIDESDDPSLPFGKLQTILADADITIGNLECPLDPNEKPGGQGLVFRCPARFVPSLVAAGFDALSTANNHSFDQGADNIDFTFDYLKTHGILPIGTFPKGSINNSRVLSNILERNGIRFGFLAYSYTAFNDGGKSTHPQIATLDIEQLQTEIGHMRQENAADILIVNMHAGTEYTRHPNQEQIDFAHAAIDAGADVIIGHHPHWIQDIEIYKDKPIFYSLGNFVFDQMWSQDTREGLMVKLNFSDKKLDGYELLPVIIDNYCCPRLADEQEKATILDKLKFILK